MTGQKNLKVTIRFDGREKIFLEEKAEAKCMSLSQYIRYIMLMEDDDREFPQHHKSAKAENSIIKDAIAARCYSKAVAIKLLNEEEFQEVQGLIKSLYAAIDMV